jgi:primase-polymerase (primpol)-like protein
MKFFHGLPTALKPYENEQRFVVWKRVPREDGSFTKPAFQPQAPQEFAKPNDPSTWSNFAVALRVYESGESDGIGICLLGSNLVAFDLDDCRDPKTGAIEPTAQRLIERAKSMSSLAIANRNSHHRYRQWPAGLPKAARTRRQRHEHRDVPAL